MAAILMVSGCLGGSPGGSTPGEDQAPSMRTHVLEGALEPLEFAAPLFTNPLTVGATNGLTNGGEPLVWAHTDGTLYMGWVGCDVGKDSTDLAGGCGNGPVYRSDDAGKTWVRLNRPSDGKLSEDGPNANGDNDVTVDANGSVYATNLGRGIQVWRSDDRGATWKFLNNAVPENTGADRQWLAAADAGHVILAYMQTTPKRSLALRTTWDAGATWSNLTLFSDWIGWLGTVQFGPDGRNAYVPYTEPAAPLVNEMVTAADYKLMVAHTSDGGIKWESQDTGARVRRSASGLHWSGVLMAPSLDVTGDGTVVYAWSEEVNSPADATATGTRVRFVASADQGKTWTKPTTISAGAQAIMPWVTGGAGDRFAVNHYASDIAGDSDYVGRWDVVVAVVDDAMGTPKVLRTTIEKDIHVGGLCARGTQCRGSDRDLKDFAEADLLPDGRLVVTYAADPLADGNDLSMKIAIQSGGTPLMMAPDP